MTTKQYAFILLALSGIAAGILSASFSVSRLADCVCSEAK